MFHQNLMFWQSKSPVIPWITGLFLLGCPDGLEPSTFRTTSNLSNSPIVPLFIDVCDFIENRVCVDYTPFCLAKGRNMRRFFERQRLVSQTKHKKFNTKYRTMTIAYYQSG